MESTLVGNIYIGFPKALTTENIQVLYNEIFDYIDNNEDVTLEELKADEDYKTLDFKLEEPSQSDNIAFHYKTMIIDNPYIYNYEQDHWH